MGELQKRIASGLTFLFVFWGTFHLSVRLFDLLIFVIMLVALYEFKKMVPLKGIRFWLASLVYPILPFLFIFPLNNLQFRKLLIVYFIMISAFDTSCYIFGKMFGKTKINSISPNKSWEGFVGGVLVMVLYLEVYFRHIPVIGLIIFSTSFGALALAGDMFESWLKRRAGIKDSGRIMPGHGGVLDRFDTITFTLPLVYALRYYLVAKLGF